MPCSAEEENPAVILLSISIMFQLKNLMDFPLPLPKCNLTVVCKSVWPDGGVQVLTRASPLQILHLKLLH